MNFLSGVQFGNLKPKDTVPPLPKAKLSKRAHLWFGIQIVVPFLERRCATILNPRVKYRGEGERCQGGASLKIFLFCLDLALWSRSLNSASKVEIGGEDRGQRIEQGWPATFSQRTSLWSVQPFVGQHDFRDRTVVEKVQCDDGSPALRCSAGPGIDQFFGWNNLQVGADHGTAVL